MKDLLLTLLHRAVTAAKLCGPGGVRAVLAENLLLKQQLIVLRRARQRGPNLSVGDRLLCGFGSLFLSPGRIRKVAIGVRPSTLLTFHQALVDRTCRRLFSLIEMVFRSGVIASIVILARWVPIVRRLTERVSAIGLFDSEPADLPHPGS